MNLCKRDNFVHLHICETVKPRCDIVENAGHSSVKGEAKAEKDGEDDVGEDGGEVDSLPQALHPLDQGQEDDEPGENKAAGQLQADSPNLRESDNYTREVDLLQTLPDQCQGRAPASFLKRTLVEQC